jgi:hypothetical protein
MVPVKLYHVGEIEVGEYVAVEDHKGIIQQLLRIFHRPPGSQWRLLEGIGQPHPKIATIPKITLYAVGKIADGEYYLVDVMCFEVIDHMLQEWFVGHGDHWFGDIAG